jgi:hypothetical protein
LWAAAAFATTFFAAFMWSLIRIARARHHRRPVGRLRILAFACAGLDLAFLAGLIVIIVLRHDHRELLCGLPPLAIALLRLPLLMLPLTAVVLMLAIAEWRRADATMFSRVRHTAFALIAVMFFPFLGYWNLL